MPVHPNSLKNLEKGKRFSKDYKPANKVACSINQIDDRFPFDLTKSLDFNLEIMKNLLLDSGMSLEETEKFILEKKNSIFIQMEPGKTS